MHCHCKIIRKDRQTDRQTDRQRHMARPTEGRKVDRKEVAEGQMDRWFNKWMERKRYAEERKKGRSTPCSRFGSSGKEQQTFNFFVKFSLF